MRCNKCGEEFEQLKTTSQPPGYGHECDLVTRLQEYLTHDGEIEHAICDEAASEIKRLRHGIRAAYPLIMATDGPNDEPTRWDDTWKSWQQAFATEIEPSKKE
jgi:hypothetical protein